MNFTTLISAKDLGVLIMNQQVLNFYFCFFCFVDDCGVKTKKIY